MRAQTIIFLLVGFAVGFGGVYTWTKQRAPSVVRATPAPVDPNVPTDLSASNGGSEAPPPPIDMAKVKELAAKIKQNPKDFDSIVELGNMKNPADVALITSPDGRQKYASAVVKGIAGFLSQSGGVRT